MSLRRFKRTIHEEDSDNDAVALKPGAGPVMSTPRKISIQSEDEDYGDDIDRGEVEDEERNQGSVSLAREDLNTKIQNTTDEGNENTQVTNGDPITASNPVELTPGNPHVSPTGIRSYRDRSKMENERQRGKRTITAMGLTSASAGHESDGGELDDSEVEWDNGNTPTHPTQRLQNVCKSRVGGLRWSGRRSECVAPESKLKGKGKANNKSDTSSRRECEMASSGAGGKGKGGSRSKGSFEAGRSSSSSPEVVRRTKGGRRIVPSDSDRDADDDQYKIPPGEKWKPDSGPSTRLRARMTTYASPNPTSRSGRPKRAAASNAVNYALLHEGQPLHDDYDNERYDVDDESDCEAQRQLLIRARKSTSERRTKSNKRHVGFPEDNDNESDEWLELIEDEHGESTSRAWKKRIKHEDHSHNHVDSGDEEGGSHAELFHRQMMEDEQSDPDDHTIGSLLNPARGEDVHELFCVYLEYIGKAVQGTDKNLVLTEERLKNSKIISALQGRALLVVALGTWNQEFKSAVMTYPFVTFGLPMVDADVISSPEPCTACHRRERANMSVMYLAGNAYDSRQIWMKSRWDQLLPGGWEDPFAMTTSRMVIREWLPMGATCRDKSYLYHTLLHYKLYLACKIRHKMDEERITPEMLKLPRFQGFRNLEKSGFDEMLGRAEWMAKMKAEVPDFHLEHGLKAIRRWQSIPKMVVEKAEANLGRNIDPTKEGDQSNDSDFTEEEHVIPPRSRSRNAKRGRYGHAFSSSDSDNPNDMSDFIVDG